MTSITLIQFVPVSSTGGQPGIYGEIIPLRIAVVCVTWCHSGICQSGEEEEQVFVHHGSLKSNKDLDNTVLANAMLTLLHEVIIKWLTKLWQSLCRSWLLKMPAVLQLALLKKFRSAARVHFESNCVQFVLYQI